MSSRSAAMSLLVIALCCLSLLWCRAQQVAPNPFIIPYIESTFDSTAENWTVVNQATNFQWLSRGAIKADDGSGTAWGFAAPSKFLGPKSEFENGTISWELMGLSGTSPYAIGTVADIMLQGGDGLILGGFISANPVLNVSRPYSIRLQMNATDAGYWRVMGSLMGTVITRVATLADLRSVLTNVTALVIRGEYISGTDSMSLDNVVMRGNDCPIGMYGTKFYRGSSSIVDNFRQCVPCPPGTYSLTPGGVSMRVCQLCPTSWSDMHSYQSIPACANYQVCPRWHGFPRWRGAMSFHNGSTAVMTFGSTTYGGNSADVVDRLQNNVWMVVSTSRAFAALKRDGSVITWPTTDSGFGGNSSLVADQLTSDVVYLYSNMFAFAAVKKNGSVVAWGDPRYGGNSSTVQFDLSSDVIAIFSTDYAFAALKSNGSVITWGSPLYGGDSSSVKSKLASGVVAVYGTSFTFAALKNDSSVVSWGNTPSASASLSSGVWTLFANSRAFAALKLDGSLFVWGTAASGGTAPSGLSYGVVSVIPTTESFMALMSDGSAMSWGRTSAGLSMAGSQPNGTVKGIVGSHQAFAVQLSNSSVVCFGDGAYGGNCTAPQVKAFVSLNVSTIVANGRAFVAQRADSTVMAWGDSRYGGDATSVSKSFLGVSLSETPVYGTHLAFCGVLPNGGIVRWGNAVASNFPKTIEGYSVVLTMASTTDAFAGLRFTCDAGYYADPYFRNCSACEPGTYLPNAGAINASACLPVPRGYYSSMFALNSTAFASACPPGTYSEVSGALNDSVCLLLPAGFYSSQPALGFLSLAVPCPSGTFSVTAGATNSSVCQFLSAGYYSAEMGLNSTDLAENCPAGSYSGLTRAGSVLSSIPAYYCAATKNFYRLSNSTAPFWSAMALAASETMLSVPGHLATITTAGEFECIRNMVPMTSGGIWLGGSDSRVEGRWEWIAGPEDGTVFYVNGSCVSGALCAFRVSEPNDSGLGEDSLQLVPLSGAFTWYWNDLNGTSSMKYLIEWELPEVSLALRSNTCSLCPAGTFSLVRGATNASVCQLLPAGYFSADVGIGNLSDAQRCPPGTYSSTTGALNASVCHACTNGTYSSAPASSACLPCLGNTSSYAASANCSLCQPGYYGSACTACPLCLNGGHCLDGVNGTGQCSCLPRFSGLTCNICFSDWYSYPACNVYCLNATTCSGRGLCNPSSGSCICSPGWSGPNCTQRIVTVAPPPPTPAPVGGVEGSAVESGVSESLTSTSVATSFAAGPALVFLMGTMELVTRFSYISVMYPAWYVRFAEGMMMPLVSWTFAVVSAADLGSLLSFDDNEELDLERDPNMQIAYMDRMDTYVCLGVLTFLCILMAVICVAVVERLVHFFLRLMLAILKRSLWRKRSSVDIQLRESAIMSFQYCLFLSIFFMYYTSSMQPLTIAIVSQLTTGLERRPVVETVFLVLLYIGYLALAVVFWYPKVVWVSRSLDPRFHSAAFALTTAQPTRIWYPFVSLFFVFCDALIVSPGIGLSSGVQFPLLIVIALSRCGIVSLFRPHRESKDMALDLLVFISDLCHLVIVFNMPTEELRSSDSELAAMCKIISIWQMVLVLLVTIAGILQAVVSYGRFIIRIVAVITSRKTFQPAPASSSAAASSASPFKEKFFAVAVKPSEPDMSKVHPVDPRNPLAAVALHIMKRRGLLPVGESAYPAPVPPPPTNPLPTAGSGAFTHAWMTANNRWSQRLPNIHSSVRSPSQGSRWQADHASPSSSSSRPLLPFQPRYPEP